VKALKIDPSWCLVSLAKFGHRFVHQHFGVVVMDKAIRVNLSTLADEENLILIWLLHQERGTLLGVLHQA
jgi:hypothetical protein